MFVEIDTQHLNQRGEMNVSKTSRTGILALAVAVAVTVGGFTAFAKKGGAAKDHRMAGVVTAVDTAAKTGVKATVTVEHTHLEKKEQKQFSITDTTVIERLHKKQATPAALSDITQGVNVRITATGTQAQKVQILGAHKGKHKKNGNN